MNSRRHFKRISRARVAMIFCAAALASLSACNRPPPPPPVTPATVTVSRPLSRTVADWDEYTGHLVSPETASISARVSGIIETAPFKEGALVKKGDVLFTIDDRPFKADLDNKKAITEKDDAQVAFTQAQLARAADLLKKKAVSQQDYDTNQAQFDQAKAQAAADRAAVETAQLNLDWTKVTAPISGRVGRISVTVGNLVNGGAGIGQATTMLTSIVSVDPMYCYVSVPERAFLKYQSYAEKTQGQSVRQARIPCFVQLETEKGFPHAGAIDFIDNNVDPNTGTIQLRGVIPNPTGILTPGLFAQMRITGTGEYRTLLIPDIAVGAEQNERFVLVVGADNVVASRRVELGNLFGSLRSITEGLKPDDRVIVNGLQLARPGSKVAAKEEPISADAIAALDKLTSELDKEAHTSAPATPPTPAAEAKR